MTRTHQPPPVVPGTIRIRLRGLPADTDRATTALTSIFQITTDGGNKPLRHENTGEAFRFVTAAIPDPRKISCVLCGCTGETECEGGCTWMPNPYGAHLCTACGQAIADLAAEWAD